MLTVATLSAPAAAGAVERFLLVVGGLLGVVRDRGGRSQAADPLVRALYLRLDRLVLRFAILALKLRKRRFGTLPPNRRRRPSERSPSDRSSSSPPPNRPRNPPLPRLPAGFGWLLRFLPETEYYASQLRHRLSDPDFLALLATAPSLQREVRLLCNILGVDFPELPDPKLPPPEIPAPPWSPATDHRPLTPPAPAIPALSWPLTSRSLATIDDRTLAEAIARLKRA